MLKENVKTREDLAQFLADETTHNRPDLSEDEVLMVVSAVMSIVNSDALVPSFLKGYKE